MRERLIIQGVVQERLVVRHREVAFQHPEHGDGVERIPVAAARLLVEHLDEEIRREVATVQRRDEEVFHPRRVQQRVQRAEQALVPVAGANTCQLRPRPAEKSRGWSDVQGRGAAVEGILAEEWLQRACPSPLKSSIN